MEKLIRIPTHKYIGSLGVRGPILRPFKADEQLVAALIQEGLVIEEVTNQGMIKLDLSNYDKDNNIVAKAVKTGIVTQPVTNKEFEEASKQAYMNRKNKHRGNNGPKTILGENV